MNNILVIGGAGFVGSTLTEELVKENNKVIVVDNLFLGAEENLEKIKDRIKLYVHDYADSEFMEKILAENDIEYVYHFGGFSSAPMFDGKVAGGYDTNIVGFAKLLQACLGKNVKRVIYASTSSMYGGNDVQSEDVRITPQNFYSLTKYVMEHTARLFYEIHGIESIGFRFFSVYGKNEKHKGKFANLVSQFLWAIKEGSDVIIYGDGTQTRDFTYIKDVVAALMIGMRTDSEFARGSVYNIGTSESYTINEMIKILEEETEKKAHIKYVENPIKNYVKHTKASTEKIKNDLGFNPKFSLREGIRDMLK